ncbi:STAS domain-containing protein [Streptomyces sp. R35]|uniref:STAS domain-containing protein n=1 Tax=Streptomyces sp. R35 TaxID=3238630 RepID=A0AB39SJ15_9ACTN
MVSADTATPRIPAEVPRAPGRRPVLAGVPEGCETVVVSGNLTLATVPGLRARLLGACRSPGRQLTLDLSGVTSCDTLGLGLLVATARRVHLSGGDLRLAAPSRAVVEALSDSGLIRLLRVLPDAGTAVGTTAAEAHAPGLRAAA